MCNICILFSVLLGASVVSRLSILPVVSGELRDILKLCDYVNCDANTDPRFSQQSIRPDANYKIISAGLPQIFWDDVRRGEFYSRGGGVSTRCRRQLEIIANGLSNDQSFAYGFIDASGKSPAGTLRSTMTSMGDYDQCLGIHHVDAASGESFTGKYCMIDMFSMRWDNNSSDNDNKNNKKIDLSRVSVFSGFPHWTAMCLPSACKEQEMQSALADLMRPYGMKVDGEFSCDTADEISWINRIKNMTMHQVIAAVLVVSFLAFVSACTAHDVYNKYIFGNISAFDPIIPQSDTLKSFSMLESSNKLLYSKAMSYEVMIFEMMKVGIVLSVSC